MLADCTFPETVEDGDNETTGGHWVGWRVDGKK